MINKMHVYFKYLHFVFLHMHRVRAADAFGVNWWWISSQMVVKFQIHMFILPAICFKFLGPGLSLKSSSFPNAVKLDVFCQLAILTI